MIGLILSAIGLGIMLSLVLIGPIFFLLIDTSFTRGARHALALDLGVVCADIICIIASFYASADIVEIIDEHPGFYEIAALIIFSYGMFMMLSKTKMRLSNEKSLISKSYFKTFLNGLLLNLVNIGVLLFWLVTVITVRNQYPDIENFFLYIGIVIFVYLGIDALKILLARKFYPKFTPKLMNIIRKCVGAMLLIVSVILYMQSYKKFNQFDKKIEEAKKTEVKYQKAK